MKGISSNFDIDSIKISNKYVKNSMKSQNLQRIPIKYKDKLVKFYNMNGSSNLSTFREYDCSHSHNRSISTNK